MTTVNQTLKVEKKNTQVGTINSKRATWNSKRKHNYRYVTSVF